MSKRESFTTPLGFILSASGAAVGLGNIWGFPTQAATHGGAAFLFVYLFLVFVLGYPMLIAELTIGRYTQKNPAHALVCIANTRWQKFLATGVGLLTLTVPALVLSFYTIVAGWFLCYLLLPVAQFLQLESAQQFLSNFSTSRNIISTIMFSFMTIYIVCRGIRAGIERCSERLMPMLLVLLLILFVYILFQDGAIEGLNRYLTPDFSKAVAPSLLISALGQAFFSLTIGGGVMVLYGSYLPKNANVPKTALMVALVDTGVAFLAGLVILPAMYVALHQGIDIFSAEGTLTHSDTLIFQILPALFDSMGHAGKVISLIFFALMTIAALTSSISMLEVPVAFYLERTEKSRQFLSLVVGFVLCMLSILICFYFDTLFDFIIQLSTQIIQPFTALMICIFCGWIWQRHELLKALTQSDQNLKNAWFYKIWPWYVRLICPVLILMVFVYPFLSF